MVDMSETTFIKADPTDAGCWIDGHWGQYGQARLVEIANDLGLDHPTAEFDGSARLVEIARKHLASMGPFNPDSPDLDDDEYEYLFDSTDAVEGWLNDNIAPEGFSFGWHDGEFFLWSTETWAEGD